MRSPVPQPRSPILLLAALLLLATGLALSGVSPTISEAGPTGLPPTGTAALLMAEHFYAAANTVVTTGDVGALDALLAPDFVDHAAIPGLSSGREGLLQLLLARHRTM